jgi:thiosulfate/3-mercaptopyruvate sulfurtransferase
MVKSDQLLKMKHRVIFILACIITAGIMSSPAMSAKDREIRIIKQPLRGITELGIAKLRVAVGQEPIQIAETGTEPWTEKQLLAPADLASVLNNPKAKKPVIFCVGPGALIRGSIDTGPAKEKENLEKLKQQLSRLPKDADIVIYCGCCPFEHCPNIRPAFTLLNEMKFSNARLLNLEHNIKTDWVAKGYPQE